MFYFAYVGTYTYLAKTFSLQKLNSPVFMIFPPNKFNFLSNSSKNDAFIPTSGTPVALLCFTVTCSFKLLLLNCDGDCTAMPHELSA